MLKTYTFDTHRTRPPHETVKEVLSRLKSTGIWDEENVRLYPIGDMDIFKEHVYCVFSNVGKRNNWGKGLTKYQAIASALMEFCERYSWFKVIEKINESPTYLYSEIPEPKISLEDMLLTRNDIQRVKEGIFYNEEKFPYIQAYSLTNEVNKFIPWYEPEFLTSNCLGAGNTLSEATLHAIYETIERHRYNTIMANLDDLVSIDISTITHKGILELISKTVRLGFEVYIFDCGYSFGVHTIGAIIYNKHYQFVTHYSMNFHMGTHSNKDIAILRALTEIIQNRAANYDNNRTNLWEVGEDNFIEEKDIFPVTRYYLNCFREGRFKKVSYQSLKNYEFDDVDEECSYIISNLKNEGFEVLLIDITDSVLKIPCVRVLIPGLQPMIFELYEDATCPGVRVSKYIKTT